MPVNTTWSDPSTAGGSGGIDLAAGDTLSETVWDRLISNLNRLGGADGNTKTGDYAITGTNVNLLVGTSTANGYQVQGVTIDQTTNDDEILTLKSTGDIAHGLTNVTATDTFAKFAKVHPTNGGVDLTGISANIVGVNLVGVGKNTDTTHDGTSTAPVTVVSYTDSGTGVASLPTNANAFAVWNGSSASLFLVDADGDMFNNGSSGTSTTYDGEDDAALLEALTTWMSPAREAGYKFRLARDLETHKAALVAGGVVTLNPDGSLGMLSYKGMLGLLVDAIRQVTHAHRALEARVAPLLTTP